MANNSIWRDLTTALMVSRYQNLVYPLKKWNGSDTGAVKDHCAFLNFQSPAQTVQKSVDPVQNQIPSIMGSVHMQNFIQVLVQNFSGRGG